MYYKKIDPYDPRELQSMQRAGRLWWQDSTPAKNAIFGVENGRKTHLSKHRRDFTESTLRNWASAGELFEGIE